ncbi:hypothetical protein [Clostridium uliginosum]|uniref:Uncharacterized protein n=1 Tax=Clostridium uliginosum TaxID=119641 RepID=A0A1I1JIY4_9CLOT|nr:hypothetical protein [Clostridium uliginosum]SFC47932.1 hypothetical protein SAMN05421842_10433 [Clostridium uliginosum]
MKKILLPQRAKITPKEVLEEINKFGYINKSPYSSTYYNVPGITWDYKPEGSLRISDHWNFVTHGSKHCLLAHTEEVIQSNWILAKYIDGKYHILKEFGINVPGYRFIEVNKNELELLKDLYNKNGIVSSKEWYKKYHERPKLVKESHTKNKKVLLKNISDERLKKFKEENKDVKKVVFIEEKYMNIIQTALTLYEKSSEFDEFCKTEQGINKLINIYKAYEFKDNECESFEEIFILVLDNGMAIKSVSIMGEYYNSYAAR